MVNEQTHIAGAQKISFLKVQGAAGLFAPQQSRRSWRSHSRAFVCSAAEVFVISGVRTLKQAALIHSFDSALCFL